MNDEESEALGRIFKALPKKKRIPARAVLKKVKVTEASRPKMKSRSEDESGISIGLTRGDNYTFDFDQDTWNRVVHEYQNDYVPIDRSPENFINLKDPFTSIPIKDDIPESDKIYAWELENEITNDFVKTVRDGQVSAANENGIDDFVWISILDDKTDECCQWRHGLLTGEIEDRLAKDDSLSEDCDAVVPPAHFNCRCTLAPASKDLQMVNNTDLNQEFDEWLSG